MWFDNLPDEILDRIFGFLTDDTDDTDGHYHDQKPHNDLPSLLRVSRRWYNVCEPLIWRNARLTSSNVPHFVQVVGKSAASLGQQAHLMFSLPTNRVRSLFFQCTYGWHIGDTPKNISTVLPLLQNLSSFSLVHQVNPLDPWGEVAVTVPILADLVCSLPGRLEHFELRSFNTYLGSSTQETCLCSVLAPRLEGLRSLTLEYLRICPRLLAHGSTTLQHLLINGVRHNITPAIRSCSAAQEMGAQSWDERHRLSGELSRSATVSFMHKACEILIDRRKFPQLRKLVFLENRRPDRATVRHWSQLLVHMLKLKDADVNKDSSPSFKMSTACLPVWQMSFKRQGADRRTSRHLQSGKAGEPGVYILRQCMHGVDPEAEWTGHPSQATNTIHSCQETDIIGSGFNIHRLLEYCASGHTPQRSFTDHKFAGLSSFIPALSGRTAQIFSTAQVESTGLLMHPQYDQWTRILSMDEPNDLRYPQFDDWSRIWQSLEHNDRAHVGFDEFRRQFGESKLTPSQARAKLRKSHVQTSAGLDKYSDHFLLHHLRRPRTADKVDALPDLLWKLESRQCANLLKARYFSGPDCFEQEYEQDSRAFLRDE